MEKLPEDVMFHILKGFSPKSLLQFKSVCKRWRYIIENPEFVDLHRINSYHRPGGINFLVSSDPYSSYYRESLENEKRGRIEQEVVPELEFYLVNTCHKSVRKTTRLSIPALLTLQGLVSPCYTTEVVEGLVRVNNIIWNPSTRKTIDLPLREMKFDNMLMSEGMYRISCDYALGFDNLTKKHKVLSICRKGTEIIVEVYTLGNHSWRRIDGPHDHPEILCDDNPLIRYVNNVVYFIRYTSCYDMSCDHKYSIDLLAFDLSSEKFAFITLPLPNVDNSLFLSNYVLEVKGCLALIDDECTKIWMLHEEEPRKNKYYWKVVEIRFPKSWGVDQVLYHGNKRMLLSVNPYGSTQSGEILFAGKQKNMKFKYPEEVSVCFCYDIERKSIRMIGKLKGYECSTDMQAYECRMGCIFPKHVETIFPLD